MTTNSVGSLILALAIVHTFSVKRFQHLAHRYPQGSVGENIFHLLGEVEVVFGLWAGLFILYMGVVEGFGQSVKYLEGLIFTEPVFVFVVMAVCATRPIMSFATSAILALSRLLPLPSGVSFYLVTLVLGPLLGSLITEPAAMTVTALILLDRFYVLKPSLLLKYATLGLLFVNISVGGTLTHFAAPPVLMVAAKWNWDLAFMLEHFAWRAVLSCFVSTVAVVIIFWRELKTLDVGQASDKRATQAKVPLWVTVSHLVFLSLIVVSAHYVAVFMWLFLFFLGLTTVTREYQDELKLREGLLVAFFLGGIVILGPPQRWWLEPLLTQFEAFALFAGAMVLTAVTDNAALTSLGAQVPNLPEASRYALVAGAVVGGGLTVVANAPNPAGYGILNRAFGDDGISPLLLFLSALGPTLVAAVFFWLI